MTTTPQHDIIYQETFPNEAYWGCKCGASGSVHVGGSTRPVQVGTRVAANFAKHVKVASRPGYRPRMVPV